MACMILALMLHFLIVAHRALCQIQSKANLKSMSLVSKALYAPKLSYLDIVCVLDENIVFADKRLTLSYCPA